MLTVKTFVGPSKIHGLGCFAAEDIGRGFVVWRFDQLIDKRVCLQDIRKICGYPPAFFQFLKHHGYVNQKRPDYYVLCSDHAMWMNFDTQANLAMGEEWCGEDVLVADRYIEAGEELTVPLESDEDATRKLGR